MSGREFDDDPGMAHDFNGGGPPINTRPSIDESLDYNTNQDSESYYYGSNDGTSVTGQSTPASQTDATETVREMHLALLYLLSNPEEFKKAISAQPPQGTTTLAEWNAELEHEDDESVLTADTLATPLPFVVFASDAEVVLPQAHTASQLFGIEQVEGIELEAAGGMVRISQLFLRWLALMPQGDHLNIIDPPGLTVMRIAGGRYRVTAAHRCVWTWMNEFAPLSKQGFGAPSSPSSPTQTLQLGDLVTMTIVDVFETDAKGKLLSYCPTFDNRAVRRTNQTTETIRKSSHKFFSMLGRAQKVGSEVNKRASAQLKHMGIMQQAKMVAENVKHRVDEAVQNYGSPNRRTINKPTGGPVTDSKEFEQVMAAAEEAAAGIKGTSPAAKSKPNTTRSGEEISEAYFSDDETQEQESAEI